MVDPSWMDEFVEPGSSVDRVSPRLLGRLLAGFGGTMNDGVGGAEDGWPSAGAWDVESASLGSKFAWRVDADVLTNKFLVLRIFLFGESARLRPGSVPIEMENFCSAIVFRAARVFTPKGFNAESGRSEVGDSGDELGEGSVSEESTVEIVVVGDESADSKVDTESRRKMGDEK